MDTLATVRSDARLFIGAATWLHRYGALVDGHELAMHLATARPEPSRSAVLACLITASSSPQLKGLLRGCEALPEERPLFSVMEDRPVLRAKVTAKARPEFRRWGFLVDDLELKPEALRPTSWVLRSNPTLRIRALLGANLRAAVFDRVLHQGPVSSVSGLARQIGRAYPSVHAAVSALIAGGLLEAVPRGRSVRLEVSDDIATWIRSFPGALPAGKRKAAA